jgi:hypothetical protein
VETSAAGTDAASLFLHAARGGLTKEQHMYKHLLGAALMAIGGVALADTTTTGTTSTTQSTAPAPGADSTTTTSMTQTTTTKSFASLDRNHDGSISSDELAADAALSARFSTLDTDHDNRLSQAEFSVTVKP